MLNVIRKLFGPPSVVIAAGMGIPSHTQPLIIPKLSWEVKEGARGWSEYVFQAINGQFFDALDKAKDTERIFPGYSKLSRVQRIAVLSEMIASISFFESSWNPKAELPNEKDNSFWALGLMQVSVNDQKNHGLKYNYTFEQLKRPRPNLHLALTILSKQVEKTGYLILSNKNPSKYWATFLDGNEHSKVNEVIARIKENFDPGK